MRKLASTLPLQDMIRGVIARATEKVAADASKDEKVKDLVSYEKREHGHIPSVAEEKAEMKKTASRTDPAWVEKLASACDTIAANVDNIETPEVGVLQTAIKKLAGESSPQGPGKGPTALEINEKPVSGTQKYKKDKPAGEDAAASTSGKPLHGARPADGSTQLENNMGTAPGGAPYPEKGPLVNLKTASPRDRIIAAVEKRAGALSPAEAAKQHILSKLAGEDVAKASISAARNADPLPGGGELTVTDASQAGPKQPGDPTGGFGNQGRKHIASNGAAINYTKGDAKGPQKTQLKEVLDEPALSKKTDSKLQENLRNAGKAGVKIAAAREALQKIASEGCKCNGTGECKNCCLKKVAQKGPEKTANAMMGYGGGGGGMGGGMGAVADAGASADGCTCGGTGECRVCKLKAALAAAKAPGGPVDQVGGGMGSTAPAVGTY